MGRESRPARLATAVFAAALVALSVVNGAGGAQAASARPASVTALSIPGELDGVAATSPTNAWAVGYLVSRNSKPDTLIMAHWDGVNWKRVTVPGFPYGQLLAVAAVSKNDVWAVGENESYVPGYNRPPFGLVLHWNGKAWRPVPIAFAVQAIPTAVTATAKDVWVALSADTDELLHETGGHWYVVPVTQSGSLNDPLTIAMSSPKSGWLGGTNVSIDSNGATAFEWHWNGASWKHIPVKVHDQFSVINAMAGLPGGTVWAVGQEAIDPNNGNTFGPLTLRWNGKAWLQVPVNIQGADDLFGVAPIPAGTAWAVGTMDDNLDVGALVARWTGTAWKQAPSPAGDWADILYAVTATSVSDAWAVGEINTPLGSAGFTTVILHWNGTTWS